MLLTVESGEGGSTAKELRSTAPTQRQAIDQTAGPVSSCAHPWGVDGNRRSRLTY